MKKVLLRSIFLLSLTIFLFYYILKDNFTESINLLLESNKLFILLGIIVLFVAFIIDSYIFKLLINRHKKDYSFKKSMELSIVTRFFNGITPFSLGGQPLQVYELSRNDVKVTDGILVVSEMFIVHEITLMIITSLAIIFKYILRLTPHSFLWFLTFIGLVVNFSILLITIFISVKINTAKKVGKLIIILLNKIHIIRDKEEAIKTFNNKCSDYSKGFKDLFNNKNLIAKCVALNIVNLLLFFSISYFAILSIDPRVDVNLLFTLVLSILIYVSATFIPIPGGSIGAEYAYANYFWLILPDNIVVTSLVLWRFISYYLPMIIGGIIFNIVDNKRSLKCKDVVKKYIKED